MITDENFDKDDIVDGVLNHIANMESESTEVDVVWAVDATLRYVIDWLRSTGHSAKAEILESLGDF